jgi:hypothetical protein
MTNWGRLPVISGCIGSNRTAGAEMNLTSPILIGAAHAQAMPGSSLTSFLRTVADTTSFWADDSMDGWHGVLMSGLAGVAAALAVAIMLTVYFRTGYRSTRDMVRHGLATVLMFGLLAFVVSDMRNAALAYLGINPTKPAVEFEIRLPKAVMSAAADTQVELHTDRNQTLAKLQAALAPDGGDRGILRGTVPLEYRTTDRVVILDVPGRAQCEFKLRLAASPSPSDQFGPWHLADRIASPDMAGTRDAFAIRYRVL